LILRLLKALLALLILVVTPVASAGTLLWTFLFMDLPARVPDRPKPNTSQISRVYDLDGNQIATYRQFETSIPVTPADIPQVVKNAVIAAEDRNFYEHGGVDLRGTVRALWADIREGEAVQGGSTITQQLVKNTEEKSERTIQRKIREAILASQLDRNSDKDDILFEYLSIIYLGEGSYGVGAAAQNYFRKSIRDLDIGEAAMLAGLIPAPSRYSPRVNGLLAEFKRRQVLAAMLEEEMITQAEHDLFFARPVWLSNGGPPPGPATIVYPPEEQRSSEPDFTDYVMRYLAARLPGGEEQVQTGGLRIETTLDPAMQAKAHEQVNGFLDGTQPDLLMSLVAVEPPTGFVKAFIGTRDWNASQVNYALGIYGGGSGRQPGSAFKPFVLAEALGQGITPDRVYSGAPHAPRECGVPANRPLQNYGGSSYGRLPLRNATWRSVNTVYTRLILDVGVDKTMQLADRVGLTSVPDFVPGQFCASVALGALDVSPLEMASAYGVFANHGARQEPTPVLRVYDREGKLIMDNTARKPAQAVSVEVADNVTDILRGVLTSGTASGKGIDRPAAGKTGTTQDNKDSWFIGYTPTLSAAVWMGYENKPGTPTKYLRGIKGVGAVTGGTHPASVWQRFMRAALDGVPITEFSEPAPIRPVPDIARREERRFFDPGPRMYPDGTGTGGPYVTDLAPPVADPPPANTTSTTAASTTTTTANGPPINEDDE
jgi:penicillin-binding protein 1A